MTRLLIVNADDFGLNSAANAGIIECFQAGSVTSTTLMANSPGFAEAVALARVNPALGVGLHFNLTWGAPLLPLPASSTLVNAEGDFLNRRQLGWRALAGKLALHDVEAELDAQFSRLRENGIQVTHVDSHQHVHGFGPIFTAVAKLCAREGIPMRVPWIAPSKAAGLGRRARQAVLATVMASPVRHWRGRVRWNDALVSVFDLGNIAEPLSVRHYAAILNASPGRVLELMVHPVNSGAAMEGYTRVGEVGEAEYNWLRMGELGPLAASLGFRLGTYSELKA